MYVETVREITSFLCLGCVVFMLWRWSKSHKALLDELQSCDLALDMAELEIIELRKVVADPNDRMALERANELAKRLDHE